MRQVPVTIITPCFNENVIAVKFLKALEQVLASLHVSFLVVVINDGSTDNTLALLNSFQFENDQLSLEVIDLKSNVGHQAAIYQGLLYARQVNCSHFIVMDSDGEDAPSVIPELLSHMDADIVNVVRHGRTESLPFLLLYNVYKILFRFLTGKEMNYGNFCLISRPVLEKAVSANFSHFAAFLSRQNCAKRFIVASKEARLGGRSKMGFLRHLTHALRSFVEYGAEWKLFKHIPGQVLKTPIYEGSADRKN